VKNKNCNEHYKETPEKRTYYPRGILRSQICANDDELGQDTCQVQVLICRYIFVNQIVILMNKFLTGAQGDSGGPATSKDYVEDITYVVGITSFGSKYCGYGDPGVYTNVQSYLDWIEGIVWGRF